MLKSLVVIAATVVLASLLRAGELLDQVVVTVNGNALLLSDLDGEVRYEAFMSRRSMSALTREDRESALNRIIDQELLREQTHGAEFKLATANQVDEQIAILKSQFAHDHAGQGWSTALTEYGLDDDQIRKHVELELNQLRLLDERLRPTVEVDAKAVEAYYREKIAPQNTERQQISFDAAKDKIRELLIQQKMNQLLDSWLESLRAQARIQYLSAGPPAAVQK